jgi:hypothetical protein
LQTPLAGCVGGVLTRRLSEGYLLARRWTAHGRCKIVLTGADHFGHRESGGIVVDLFWKGGNFRDEFRVEVEDDREGTRFVLHPRTGREAIQAFHHPFAAPGPPIKGRRRAA